MSQWWMWLIFAVIVFTALVVDMFFLGGGKAHRVSNKEALTWTIVWISLALIFNLFFWIYLKETQPLHIAHRKALEFFTGYLIEKTLSVDNIFVFLMIFNYFSIPAEYQRRILLYGVLGAIVFRLLMILGGIWLINKFDWVLYLFGLFLVFSGVKMLFFMENKSELENNPVLVFMRNHLRITKELHGENFFIKQGRWIYCTPLFVALVLVEISDIIFAIDSIPAIFAITNDPFIVVTSNIFAILGLRAIYFLLANCAEKFHLLKYGLAIILILIGLKMLIASFYKVPVGLMLIVVVLIIIISVVWSLKTKPKIIKD